MLDGPGSGAASRHLSRRELRVYSVGTVEFPLASPTLRQRMLQSPMSPMSFTHAPVMAAVQMCRGLQSWKTTARRLLFLGLAALAMVAPEPQAGADSSICSSVFLGDLNNDKKVTALDLQRFGVLRDSGQYDPCADFTRDGVLTDADGFVLTRLIQFATDASTGGVVSSGFRTSNSTRSGLVSTATRRPSSDTSSSGFPKRPSRPVTRGRVNWARGIRSCWLVGTPTAGPFGRVWCSVWST